MCWKWKSQIANMRHFILWLLHRKRKVYSSRWQTKKQQLCVLDYDLWKKILTPYRDATSIWDSFKKLSLIVLSSVTQCFRIKKDDFEDFPRMFSILSFNVENSTAFKTTVIFTNHSGLFILQWCCMMKQWPGNSRRFMSLIFVPMVLPTKLGS